MIKQKTVIEVQINEKVFTVDFSPESTLGEIHDALNQMKQVVIDVIVERNKKHEAEKEPAKE